MGYVIYYFLKTNRFNVMNIGVQRGGGGDASSPLPFRDTLLCLHSNMASTASSSYVIKVIYSKIFFSILYTRIPVILQHMSMLNSCGCIYIHSNKPYNQQPDSKYNNYLYNSVYPFLKISESTIINNHVVIIS